VSSQPTLDPSPIPGPSAAFSALKDAESAYRDGLISDQELERARDAYRPNSHPHNPDRWMQPTVPELHAAADHPEADRIRGLQHDLASRQAERAFDRLNPEFGVPADQSDRAGQRAVQEREAGLALGTRAAVAASRENDPNPIVRVAGQDYRAADAVRTARLEAARAGHGAERTGPER
jgi:hypothetical protein